MSPKSLFAILLLLLLVCLPLGCRFLQNDKRLVKRQLTEICQDVSKEPDEGNTTAALKMLSLGNRLGNSIEIQVHGIPLGGFLSGEELMAQVNRARLQLDRIHVQLLDDVITVQGNEADIDCVLRVKAASARHNYKMEDDFHLQILLKKNEDGKWLFQAFKEGPLLQK